ncbi:hypothetical protein CALVIDRAFT_543432 [Calocera viscosa TUFC12733]|uniref:Uncharacterized protein n=1 Tax=Calocera viscosa (strain TUFC12733) TaxID=1330018 RepID=A0A167FKU2_CALVF|nr:hypothetical protein CALVIDRAFT_543432 [Calocera viscosa TUFC12733]
MPSHVALLSPPPAAAAPGSPSPDAPASDTSSRGSIAKLLFGASTVFFITGMAGALIYARRVRVQMLAEEAAAAPSAPATQSSPVAASPAPPAAASSSQPLILPSRPSGSSPLHLPRPGRPPKPPPSSLSLSPLHALGAFGLASLSVLSLAGAGMWSVKYFTGVKDMDEFALKARLMLGTALPGLSARVRAVAAADPPLSSPTPPSWPSPAASQSLSAQPLPQGAEPEPDGEWTAAAAEERLTRAFAEGGLAAWAEQGDREVEAERAWELRGRGVREGMREGGKEG